MHVVQRQQLAHLLLPYSCVVDGFQELVLVLLGGEEWRLVCARWRLRLSAEGSRRVRGVKNPLAVIGEHLEGGREGDGGGRGRGDAGGAKWLVVKRRRRGWYVSTGLLVTEKGSGCKHVFFTRQKATNVDRRLLLPPP